MRAGVRSDEVPASSVWSYSALAYESVFAIGHLMALSLALLFFGLGHLHWGLAAAYLMGHNLDDDSLVAVLTTQFVAGLLTHFVSVRVQIVDVVDVGGDVENG